jgi:hypothetical protein
MPIESEVKTAVGVWFDASKGTASCALQRKYLDDTMSVLRDRDPNGPYANHWGKHLGDSMASLHNPHPNPCEDWPPNYAKVESDALTKVAQSLQNEDTDTIL